MKIDIDRLWISNLTDKMKCSFFQAAVVSILLYGCTTSFFYLTNSFIFKGLFFHTKRSLSETSR